MTEYEKRYIQQTLATAMGIAMATVDADIAREMVQRFERSMRLVEKIPATADPVKTDAE